MDTFQECQRLHNTSNLEEFITLGKINFYLNSNTNIYLDKPFYFGTKHGFNNGIHSNVGIYQIIDGNIEISAYFLSRYNYSKALSILLKNQDDNDLCGTQLRMFVSGKQTSELLSNRYEMTIDIKIRKDYLLSMYTLNKLPYIIHLLLFDISPGYFSKKFIIEYNKPSIINNPCIQFTLKRDLFNHQKKNIIWMKNLERLIDQNQTNLPLYKTNRYCISRYIKSINDMIIHSTIEEKMIDPSRLEIKNITLNGGILADDIGLGKTFSIIGLIHETRNESKNPSIVICPRRLCKQWKEEIDKSCDMNSYIISSITQFKKLNLENIRSYDIIILSYTFLTNEKYYKYKQQHSNDNSVLFLERYEWERCVLDEFHEYTVSSRKKHINDTREELLKFNPKYKWLCSGTPFQSFEDITNTIYFLTKYRTLKFTHYYNQVFHIFKDEYLRKNTKESLSGEIHIPEPIIENEFLELRTIERAIYDSALGNRDKMFELCNHALVSDQYINILGNKPLSLEDIHKKMTDYYEKKGIYYNKRIENLNKLEEEESTEENKNKIIEIEEKLIECKQKLTIFNNINKKLKEESQCPICFEDLENNVKTITPCGHIFCASCISNTYHHNNNRDNTSKCPCCRFSFLNKDLQVIKSDNPNNSEQLGSKMSRLIDYCNYLIKEDSDNRIIIFSQRENMLKLVQKILNENQIHNLVLNGSMNVFNSKVRKFKLDHSVKIILLSMEKNVSGLTLTEANHVILLDSFNANKATYKMIEDQAIGRAVRIGQNKHVMVKRFIMKDTIEEEMFIQNITN